MKLWTAQYRYYGKDRFDITVSGGEHLTFAPEKKDLYDFKANRISWNTYTKHYMDKIETSFLPCNRTKNKDWKELLSKDEVTLVCFCNTSYCHRYLLTYFLMQYVDDIKYMGERLYNKQTKTWS